jgi:hypothetical protein
MIFRTWNNQDNEEHNVEKVFKLSANEGIHSLLCRARKSVTSAMHHLVWVVLGIFYLFILSEHLICVYLGTTGILTLGWLLKRRSKQHEDNENTYKDFLQKITNLLENQYEEHLRDPQAKPWLAITHIRDMLIPPEDR